MPKIPLYGSFDKGNKVIEYEFYKTQQKRQKINVKRISLYFGKVK
jgi:hypothetical protein